MYPGGPTKPDHPTVDSTVECRRLPLMESLTPGQVRTKPAREARRRAADEKLADQLRGRGWLVVAPEETNLWLRAAPKPSATEGR